MIIGLTGRFGAGCTTTYNLLIEEHNFVGFSLSDFLREIAKQDKNYNELSDKNKRTYLQKLGDKLRKENNKAFIAEQVIRGIEKIYGKSGDIVIDSFKNPAEINAFRNNFSKFKKYLEVNRIAEV